MTLGAESDGVAECALYYGRMFEGFVAVEGAHEGLTTRIECAWEGAWRQGKFSVSTYAATDFLVRVPWSSLSWVVYRAAYDIEDGLGWYLLVRPSRKYSMRQVCAVDMHTC